MLLSNQGKVKFKKEKQLTLFFMSSVQNTQMLCG